MAKPVLIIKNMSREGPGLLESELQARGLGRVLVDLDRSEPLPPLEGFGAVVVLGGPDSANDLSPKMLDELKYIRHALERGLPYLGVCLGLQTLVKAAGGRVVRCPVPETGFTDPAGCPYTVKLTPAGRTDPLFSGLNDEFRVFQLHGETVEVSAGMVLLGLGKSCRNQIVQAGPRAYGIQCHFELTEDLFETWAAEDPELLALDPVRLRSDYKEIRENYTRTGRLLFGNFLDICGY